MNWGIKNEITIDANLKQSLNRKTRLDMNVLCGLAQELAKQYFIKPHLIFYPNSSIYLIGNSYRYVEYYYVNNVRFHKLNKVDFSEYLKCILEESKCGLTHKQLTALLVNDEISEDEASNFIDELITSQLIVNQLEPIVTGRDYLETILLNLKNIYAINQINDLSQLIVNIEEVNVSIKKIDDAVFNKIETYKIIHQQLKNIYENVSEFCESKKLIPIYNSN